MKGEKFVAFISLQPDRQVKNRKRTVYKRWLLLLGCVGLAYTVVVQYSAVQGRTRIQVTTLSTSHCTLHSTHLILHAEQCTVLTLHTACHLHHLAQVRLYPTISVDG